jgi:NADPH:quinone reductase-like Zn-dependent oxidoreductase
MKAVVHDRYGPPEVLRIEDVERPVPADGEVLIRVQASTVSQTDTHSRAARPFFWRLFTGLRTPRPAYRTLGVDVAGVIDAVGAGVTRFAVGDEVFGALPGFGAHAEYLRLRQTAAIAIKPATLSFAEAAAVSDGATQALATLRQAKIDGTAPGAGKPGAGKRIVIYGASGSLGTSAVQLARVFGAHITAVCNAKNMELVRSLGADEVIDYEHEDFTKNGQRYDAIIDAVGKFTYGHGRRALTPDGIYVATDLGPFGLETIAAAIGTRWFGRRRLKMAMGRRSVDDILFMKRLIEAGEYRPVVDRVYPMAEAVEAHRYVETWQKTGNVVLAIGTDTQQP